MLVFINLFKGLLHEHIIVRNAGIGGKIVHTVRGLIFKRIQSLK